MNQCSFSIAIHINRQWRQSEPTTSETVSDSIQICGPSAGIRWSWERGRCDRHWALKRSPSLVAWRRKWRAGRHAAPTPASALFWKTNGVWNDWQQRKTDWAGLLWLLIRSDERAQLNKNSLNKLTYTGKIHNSLPVYHGNSCTTKESKNVKKKQYNSTILPLVNHSILSFLH